MVKYFLTFLLSLCFLVGYTQTNLNLAVKFQISNPGSTGSSPNYTVSGIISDDLSIWSASSVQVGDSLYALNGSDLVVGVVQSISVASGMNITCVINCTNPSIVNIDPGQAAIIRPTLNNKYPTYVSGLRFDLQSAISNRLSQLIDKDVKAAGDEIIDFVGIAGVSPAPSANLYTGQTWRNSAGELYYSNGTTWLTDNEVRFSTSSLEGLSSGKYKIGIDTVGVDTLYIANNNIFRRLSISASSTVSTNSTLTGNGTVGSPLSIAQQGATSGQVLKWNGSSWLPSTDLSGGGATIDSVRVSFNTSGIEVKVNTVASPSVKIPPNTLSQSGATTNQVLTWNGTAWTPTNISGVDTLSNYTALRAYTGSAKMVVVQDFTYTFNSQSYTTIGGVFYRVPTGSENGATLIVASNGVKWARDWDRVNVLPEWWEVGGYDVDGTNNPTRFTTNGVFNNRDRLQAAVTLGANKVVKLGAIVRNYEIDIAISVNTECNIEGNGVTLKRPNSPIPLLTSTFSGTSCTVSDATGFRVGMSLLALDINNTKGRSPFYNGYGNEENSRTVTDPTKPVITAISGNTITYNVAPPASIPTGGVLMVHDDILGINNVDNRSLLVQDIIFDGNWNNGGLTYRYSNDFTSTHTLFQATNSKQIVRLEGLFFKRVPGENIIAHHTIITGCKADSLFGSFCHLGRVVQDDPAIVEVSGCEISNTGLATTAINVHGEAAITFSANPSGYNVHHNRFITGKHSVFGQLTKDEENARDLNGFEFNNNYCKNYKNIVVGITPVLSTNYPFSGINISNNTFENCGDLYLLKENGNFPKGSVWENVKINNNTIWNGRIVCSGIAMSQINNNSIIFTSEYPTQPFWGRHTSSITDGVVNTTYRGALVANGTDLQIIGNRIENPTYNDTLRVGIFCDVYSFGAFKTAAGATTDFSYSQNIKIENNTIAGFARSITMSSGNFGQVTNAVETVNIEISNNFVYNSGTSPVGYSWGINVPKGAVCKDNRVIAVTGYGIVANGAQTDYPTAGKHNTIRGATIVRNNVTGQIAIGDGGVSDWNVIVEGNTMTQSVLGGNVARNYVAGNLVVNTTNLPGLTAPQTPQFNYYLINKIHY